MINRTNTLLQNLNEQLHFVDLETDNMVLKSEKAVEICIESISKLKKLILKYHFKTQKEEILFFKRNQTSVHFQTYFLQYRLQDRNQKTLWRV